MRIHNYEQQTVNQVVEQIPTATTALRERGVSASDRYSLGNLAAATSTSTDELMAVLDYRTRRAARHQQPVAADTEAELELA